MEAKRWRESNGLISEGWRRPLPVTFLKRYDSKRVSGWGSANDMAGKELAEGGGLKSKGVRWKFWKTGAEKQSNSATVSTRGSHRDGSTGRAGSFARDTHITVAPMI